MIFASYKTLWDDYIHLRMIEKNWLNTIKYASTKIKFTGTWESYFAYKIGAYIVNIK